MFSVPQTLVSKILGQDGVTLMNLREKYGVGIAINQETREKGYSVCTIRGDSEVKVGSCKAEIEEIMIGGDGPEEAVYYYSIFVLHLETKFSSENRA